MIMHVPKIALCCLNKRVLISRYEICKNIWYTFESHCLWSYLNITNVQCSLECYIVTARNISKKESVDLIIILLCKNPKILMTNPLNVLNVSLRKQATFRDATTGFPAN